MERLLLCDRHRPHPRKQHFAQQGMKAIPAFVLMATDLDDEQIAAVQPDQPRGHARNGVRLADQGRAQGCAKAAADRHAGQQLLVVLGELLQDLALEILGEGTRIAQCSGRKASPLLRLDIQREQLQSGDPAVGQIVQPAGVARADPAKLVTQVGFGFLGAEAQVAQVKHRDEALRVQARQRKRQLAARAQHQVQVRRGVVEQPLQRLPDARVLDVMHIVEHKDQVPWLAGNCLDQRDHPMLDPGSVAAVPDEVRGLARNLALDQPDAGEQAVEKAARLVVLFGQRQPRHFEAQ